VGIGKWVIEEALAQVMRWHRVGVHLSVAVNISPRQLNRPDFAEMVSQALLCSGADPAMLELEITESSLVSTSDMMVRLLERVQHMGVRIAVDDFGTGYSALSYLKRLPLDTLKIDRTFVDGIEHDVDRSITESIVAIAHKLGLRVTAEGVETKGQYDALVDLGCDRLQGYHFSRPLEADAFERFALTHAVMARR
jgi:EAL domain-containing protein (putative c-di-GMP-specific phosphodiesterase class I)